MLRKIIRRFNRATVWTLITLWNVLISPDALAFQLKLSFAMSLDFLALHSRYRSVELIGYQPLCGGGGDYHELTQPIPLMLGTSTMSPAFDVGDFHFEQTGGNFCLIFNVHESGGVIKKVRMFFIYIVDLQQGTFTVHEVMSRLNDGGVAPRFVFSVPLNRFPCLGTFVDDHHVQLPLPIIDIRPRDPFTAIENLLGSQ